MQVSGNSCRRFPNHVSNLRPILEGELPSSTPPLGNVMRTLTSIFSILALTFALGCSDSDGGGGGGDSPDANVGPDAAPTGPDAMPMSPPITSGLGQVCDPAAAVCSGGATACLAKTMEAPSGICTLLCAEGLAPETFPAAEAHQTCADSFTGTTGTPLCGASIGPGSFACVVACGVLEGTDLGTCPSDLTCTANSCMP